MELRKTKIICTVGPAIDSEEMLIKMFDAGMNVARLNFSHATYDESIRRIENIRNACKKTNKHIGIMLDTKGPEMRVGTFEGGKCSYEKGDTVDSGWTRSTTANTLPPCRCPIRGSARTTCGVSLSIPFLPRIITAPAMPTRGEAPTVRLTALTPRPILPPPASTTATTPKPSSGSLTPRRARG